MAFNSTRCLIIHVHGKSQWLASARIIFGRPISNSTPVKNRDKIDGALDKLIEYQNYASECWVSDTPHFFLLDFDPSKTRRHRLTKAMRVFLHIFFQTIFFPELFFMRFAKISVLLILSRQSNLVFSSQQMFHDRKIDLKFHLCSPRLSLSLSLFLTFRFFLNQIVEQK